MFCPQCRTEYTDEATRCTECGSALVGGSPPREGDAEDLPMVTVFESADVSALRVVMGLLEAEGIPCVLEHDPDSAPFPGVEPLTGPARVRVPVESAEAARELVNDRSAELAEDSEPNDPSA